jgi:hypothetical protein
MLLAKVWLFSDANTNSYSNAGLSPQICHDSIQTWARHTEPRPASSWFHQSINFKNSKIKAIDSVKTRLMEFNATCVSSISTAQYRYPYSAAGASRAIQYQLWLTSWCLLGLTSQCCSRSCCKSSLPLKGSIR